MGNLQDCRVESRGQRSFRGREVPKVLVFTGSRSSAQSLEGCSIDEGDEEDAAPSSESGDSNLSVPDTHRQE